MKKLLYVYLFFIIAAAGCKENKVDPEVMPDPVTSLEFKFELKNNPGIKQDILCELKGDEVTAIIPEPGIDKSRLILSFKGGQTATKVNGVVQTSGVSINDFTKPVTYKLTFPDGKEKNLVFKIRDFTGIPVLRITTQGGAPINSKDTYVNATLNINTNFQYEQESLVLPTEIRGRGNSTWGMPKKPYRIRLAEKAKVLGLPEARNWVLLANYSDKTLIRTSVVFDLGHAIGADFTPEYRYVEVFLNNVYIGTYTLTEQVEVNPGRVEITELKKGDTQADKISGGYLLELDDRKDEEYIIETPRKLPFAVKSPGSINTEQYNYISKYLADTEGALFGPNFTDPNEGYAKYINVESFINWFLVQELVKNQDAKDFSSIFYYKDRNGKLGMGPLWDFDLSMGNVYYSEARNPLGWWVRFGPWFSRLFQDPAFAEKVRTRWKAIRNKEVKEMLYNIDIQAAKLKLSQARNFSVWRILDRKVWPNPEIYYTHEGEVAQIKRWLNTRIDWLDKNL